MARLTMVQFLDMMDREERDFVIWHRANGTHSDKAIDAYKAGFRAGARAAKAALTLHAGLFLEDRREKDR